MEINFSSLDENFINLVNHQTFMVVNCPSVLSVLAKISTFTHEHILKLSSTFCFHFVIDGEIEDLNEIQLLEIAILFKKLQKSFVIIFESAKDNSCQIYWHMTGIQQIFSLFTSVHADKLKNFVKAFLLTSLSNSQNGE